MSGSDESPGTARGQVAEARPYKKIKEKEKEKEK